MNLSIVKISLLSILSFLLSCNNDKPVNDDTINKGGNVEREKEIDSDFKDSLSYLSAENKNLTSKFNLLSKQNSELLNDKKDLELLIDSFKISVSDINQKKVEISKSAREIQNLSLDIMKSWAELAKTRDKKTITHFLLPNYRGNRISIDNDNTAQMSWYTQDNFDDYLSWMMKHKNWTFEHKNIKFLDVEIKDNLYFNSTYKYLLITSEKGKVVDKSTMMVTITGKKVEGDWKVASYSWIRFSYM